MERNLPNEIYKIIFFNGECFIKLHVWTHLNRMVKLNENLHILNIARALLFQASLHVRFQGECVLTATYLINYIPIKLNSLKSLYEILFGKSLSYTHLWVFGCLCYVHTHDRIRDKFDARATRCLFLGYPQGKKGWGVFELKNQHLFVSQDVVFYGNTFLFAIKRDELPQTQTPLAPQIPPTPAHAFPDERDPILPLVLACTSPSHGSFSPDPSSSLGLFTPGQRLSLIHI